MEEKKIGQKEILEKLRREFIEDKVKKIKDERKTKNKGKDT